MPVSLQVLSYGERFYQSYLQEAAGNRTSTSQRTDRILGSKANLSPIP